MHDGLHFKQLCGTNFDTVLLGSPCKSWRCYSRTLSVCITSEEWMHPVCPGALPVQSVSFLEDLSRNSTLVSLCTGCLLYACTCIR